MSVVKTMKNSRDNHREIAKKRGSNMIFPPKKSKMNNRNIFSTLSQPADPEIFFGGKVSPDKGHFPHIRWKFKKKASDERNFGLRLAY